MAEQEEIVLDMNEEELEKAGSKFITIPAGKKEVSRKIEITMDAGWDTPGKSVKFPIVVIEEGVDLAKTDKLSAGIGKEAVFKIKDCCVALGVNYHQFYTKVETGDGSKKISFNLNKFVAAVVGKQAYGIWKLQEGWKGGVVGGEKVEYSKLISFSAIPINIISAGV